MPNSSLLSSLLTGLFSPSSVDGYDQGYAVGTNQPVSRGTQAPVPSPLATAMNQAPDRQTLAQMIANSLKSTPALSMLFGNPQDPQTPLSPAMGPQLPPTPLTQAMAATADQTPLSQAMAPQPSTPTAISDAMANPAPLTAIQATFQHQATDPNLATAHGLISAGSALMGGKDLQQGLATAGQAFQDSFDKTLGMQRDLNTPHVTPIADGAFSMVQLPGEAPQVLPSDQVQQFLVGKAVLANQLAVNKETYTANLHAQNDQAKDDRKNADQYQAALTQTDASLAANARALAAAKGQAQNSPRMSRIAGALPGVAQTFGWDDAQPNMVIQRAHIDSALVQDALKKGAITDAQAGFLNSDIPSPTADREKVIVPFLEQQQEVLQRIRAFQANQVAKANPTAPQGFATSGTSNTAGSSAGGSTAGGQSTGSGAYQPVAVSDKASYDALPSGAVFKAPDGSIRRKP